MSEQYIDSIMHGAKTKEKNFVFLSNINISMG